MAGASARVQVQLLDPIPAIVVARVLDGLRDIGLRAELIGGDPRTSTGCSTPDGSPRRICLACGSESARRGATPPVVTLPHGSSSSQFDAGVATAVLDNVIEQLGALPSTG